MKIILIFKSKVKMAYNNLILSYNKNEEIKEYVPISSPSVSFISDSNNNDKKELIYHSFYLPSTIILDNNNSNLVNLNSNFNIYNRSYSAFPFSSQKNSKKTKTLQKLIKNNIKSNKPRKKKLFNSYNSCRNIINNKKSFSNKEEKMKSMSINKDNSDRIKDDSIGNMTIKNDNLNERVEFDKNDKKYNIFIKNNIYNFNLVNKNNNLVESKSSIKSNLKIHKDNHFINNNIDKFKKKKKPVIKNTPLEHNNRYSDNINKSNRKNNEGNIIIHKMSLLNNNSSKKLFNKDNNNKQFKFDFPFSEFKIIKNCIRKYPQDSFKYGKLLSKMIYIYNKSKNKIIRINPILNILSFLDQKELIQIINIRNKKFMTLLNKSFIDSYLTTLKKYINRYDDYLEIINSTLVYTYSNLNNSLKIDLMLNIRFIDKNKKIDKDKHYQLFYLFQYLKDKKDNKNRNKSLFDYYGFDIICENDNSKNNKENEFKGVYLSKQISRFNYDKNDNLVNIQPILPFKLNDRGIFNFEIFSNQNFFINPRNLRIKLNIFNLNENININNLRKNEYEDICKYWKHEGAFTAKKINMHKNIIKEWFDEFFFIKDFFYADIGLYIYKFNLIAKNCGILINKDLNIKIIIKEKDEYIQNEIKKNNLLFERNNSFEMRKGENIIFFLSTY